MVVMRTVVLRPRPPELERLIQRRRELGIDTYDEVWEGSYHVAPAASAAHAFLDNTLAVLVHPYPEAAGLMGTGPFNLGRSEDYWVPDRGYHRSEPRGTWVPSAPWSSRSSLRMTRRLTSSVSTLRMASRRSSLPTRRRAPSRCGAAHPNSGTNAVPKSAVMDFTVEEVAADITWPSLDD